MKTHYKVKDRALFIAPRRANLTHTMIVEALKRNENVTISCASESHAEEVFQRTLELMQDIAPTRVVKKCGTTLIKIENAPSDKS